MSGAMDWRGGRVAVLCGGWSAEREISLKSGAAVRDGLCAAGVDAYLIDAGADLLAQLIAAPPAAAFIALHGRGGEDGTLQGALEWLGIPYTGSGVKAAALAMDKLRCKQLWQGAGLPTAAFATLAADTHWAQALAALGGDVMVKPAREGSSLGMARARSAAELEAAWRAAAAYDDCVIAESWLAGPEYTVAILGDRALPAIRLEVAGEFYDYEAKYLRDDTRYHCPCGLPAAAEAELQRIALAAFASLEGRGWGRVDVMADGRGQWRLLEVNAVPGMTDHSLVPMAAKAAGLTFSELVEAILAQARCERPLRAGS